MSITSPEEEVAASPEALARQAESATREESAASDEPAEVRVHEDETRENKTPGFSRMRTDWHGPEASHIQMLASIVDGKILVEFASAFVIMNDLWDVVRERAVNPASGEVYVDAYGWPIWARNEHGAFIEDYSKLGIREREDFLFRITTNTFEWGQKAADFWGNAMFAKAMWEEAFSNGFVSPSGRLTVDDRTNRARIAAQDERYFAIFQTLLSRKADAVVRSMELIGQRLKDVLT